MKSLSKGKVWLLAVGQLGWAMLSGLISNWLVYFYQPDETAQAAGQTIFIPQGRVLHSRWRFSALFLTRIPDGRKSVKKSRHEICRMPGDKLASYLEEMFAFYQE